jgi:hypothetical protein
MAVRLNNGAAAFLVSAVVLNAAAEPPRYTAVDITDWSPAQLATLPFFKHWAPIPPSGPGVPAQFEMVDHAASGFCAGTVPQGIPYAGSEAVLLTPDGSGGFTASMVDPFGTYSWGYWSWDGHDSHYYFGYVRDSVPSDVNFAGVMVGAATIAGGGDYSSGAVRHAFRFGIGEDAIDLFPSGGSSTASGINNRGEITGYRSGVGAFRMDRDGSVTLLDPVVNATPSPRWINAEGVIIGGRYPSRSFVSPGGSQTLDLETINDFPVVTAADLNDTGWIVGHAGVFGDPETYALIWEPVNVGPGGSGAGWPVWDLVEQLDTPDVLLERAIAINNEGHIIASGHLDGTDLFNSRLYWLTPDAPPAGWCIPDIGIHPVDAMPQDGVASFTVTVVNADEVTGYAWRADGVAIDPVSNPSAATRLLELTGSDAQASGTMFDCVVTSTCGTSTSEPAALLAEPSSCPADLAEPFGVLDLSDINAFINGFVAQDPIADLATPEGVFDLADVNAFLQSFVVGCP